MPDDLILRGLWVVAVGTGLIVTVVLMYRLGRHVVSHLDRLYHQWCSARYDRRLTRTTARVKEAITKARTGREVPNYVVQVRNAEVSMANFAESMTRMGAHRAGVNSPEVDPHIADLDLAEAELRVAAEMAGAVMGGDQMDPTAMSHHQASDTSLGVPDDTFSIKVCPHSPGSPDSEDEECDLWVSTGAKPSTILVPDDGEWAEVEAMRTPLCGVSVTLEREDDVYVTVITTVVPGLGVHLEELESLHKKGARVSWEYMSPELVKWLGGLTRRERTFLLSIVGVGTPDDNVPRRPGRLARRDIDLG